MVCSRETIHDLPLLTFKRAINRTTTNPPSGLRWTDHCGSMSAKKNDISVRFGFDSAAAGAAFKDAWTLSDLDNAWHAELAEYEPGFYSVISAAEFTHGKSMKAYLIMMGFGCWTGARSPPQRR